MLKKTHEWVEKHFPNIFSGIHFTSSYSLNGDKINKSDICKSLGVEIMIEDDLMHAFDCAKKGIKVFLLDYPWNQKDLSKGIERVYSWEEILDKIH